MQSSADHSFPSNHSPAPSGDDLEEGEIGDDEDDELWQELESSLETSKRPITSNSSSPVVSVSSSQHLQSSFLSDSSKRSSSLQTDRVTGGFWAKLRTVTSQSQSLDYRNANVMIENSNSNYSPFQPRSSPATSYNFVPLAEDSTLHQNRIGGKNRLGPTFGIHSSDDYAPTGSHDDQRDSLDVECSPAKRRKVSKSYHGDLKISFASSESTSGHLAGDEEDELLELQLRLDALQSSMKRVDDSKRASMGRRPSSRRRGYSTGDGQRSRRLADGKRRSDEIIPAAYRNDVRARGHRDKDGSQRMRRQRASRSHRDKSPFISKDVRKRNDGVQTKHGSSQSYRTKPNQNALPFSPKNSRQLQQERERILSIPDPKDQYHAFLDLVTTPRAESRPGSATKIRRSNEDDLETTNMDISSCSEDDSMIDTSGSISRPNLSTASISKSMLAGFWCRLSASSGKSSGPRSANSSILRELDNTTEKLADTSCGQQSSTAPIVMGDDRKDDQDANAVAVDDEEDEEMAALRELALKSMLYSKQKKQDTMHTPTAAEANTAAPPNPTTAEETRTVNQSPAALKDTKDIDMDSKDDDEETEVVITLDKEILKKHIELARKRLGEQSSTEGISSSSKHPPVKAVREKAESRPPTTSKAKSAAEASAQFISGNGDISGKASAADHVKGKLQDFASAAGSTPSMTPPFNDPVARDSPTSRPALASPIYPLARSSPMQHPTRLAPARKLPQVPIVYHKPLLIPLDSSSDEDDAETSSAPPAPLFGQNAVASSTGQSTTKQTTQSLLGGFLRSQPSRSGNGLGSIRRGGPTAAVKNGKAVSNADLVQQLDGRLRVCVEDLARHQSSLTEDKKRLRTLESIVGRQKSDLRLAEMRMQKLKQELRTIESQSASYRVTIAKFNGEIQKVQSRVDKNFELQRVYLRQWKEIEQLVAKYKIDLVPKIPQASVDTVLPKPNHSTVSPAKRIAQKKLSVSKRRLSRNSAKTSTNNSNGMKPPVVKDSQTGSTPSTSAQQVPKNDVQDICSSPLRWFRSYRLSPSFRTLDQYKPDSTTFANKLDPLAPLCPFDLSGKCLDPICVWQHERDYLFTEVEMIADLLSYRPDVVAEGADEKMTMTFATELYNSLYAQLPLNDILLYCLSKMDSHIRDQNWPRLGVETEPRRWTIGQDSKRYKNVATELKLANVGDFGSGENPESTLGHRYFSGVSLVAIGLPPVAAEAGENAIEEPMAEAQSVELMDEWVEDDAEEFSVEELSVIACDSNERESITSEESAAGKRSPISEEQASALKAAATQGSTSAEVLVDKRVTSAEESTVAKESSMAEISTAADLVISIAQDAAADVQMVEKVQSTAVEYAQCTAGPD